MEYILINNIQKFLNDDDFLRCLSFLCKNSYLKNRTKQILKKAAVYAKQIEDKDFKPYDGGNDRDNSS